MSEPDDEVRALPIDDVTGNPESRTAGPQDVLPISYDDGSTVTCSMIAGGLRSTDRIPDYLELTFTSSDGQDVRRVRYHSDLAFPWPRFQPHPDDPRRCYVCGQVEGNHGTAVNHCPPAILGPIGPTTLLEDARHKLNRAVRSVVRDKNDKDLTVGAATLLASYVSIGAMETMLAAIESAKAPTAQLVDEVAAVGAALAMAKTVDRKRATKAKPKAKRGR